MYQQAAATLQNPAYSQPHQSYAYPSTSSTSNAQYSRAKPETDPSYFMQYDSRYR